VSKDNATYAIERIQKALDEHRFMISEHDSAQVGISIGAATFPEDGREPDILLVVADQAMYKNKAARQKKKYPSEVIRFGRDTADKSS
jgi:diguanylate cyclase (GGDEF)-like protein